MRRGVQNDSWASPRGGWRISLFTSECLKSPTTSLSVRHNSKGVKEERKRKKKVVLFYFVLLFYRPFSSSTNLSSCLLLLLNSYFFFFPSSTNASFPYSFSKSTSIFINNLEIYDHPVKMSNTSRRLDTKLIDFLTSMAQKPSLPPATRHQATYIIASYHKHRNVYRLMAHISALSNGEMVINISHGVKSMAEDKDSPVYQDRKSVV